MTTLFDAAYPGPADPHVDGCLVYIGGDTPHVWTDAEVRNAPGRYRLPTYVRSDPWAADPAHDAGEALAWLQAHAVPKGRVVVLDLETAINAVYVNAFAAALHAAGFLVWEYGSRGTLFHNPRQDGYFVADPTGTPHLVVGTAATQFAADGAYDLDDVAETGALWDLKETHHMNSAAVAVLRTPSGNGYWIFGADGEVVTFGDAPFHGSCASIKLNAPAVGAAATADAKGYWIACADGGVFTFGDAQFHGSLSGKTLNKPVVGIAATPDGKGYWLVAADGGVFTFGDAHFEGSAA